jgi:hypothetical protein
MYSADRRLPEDDPLTQQIPTRVRSECNANRNQRAMLHSYHVAVSRVREAVTFPTACRGGGGGRPRGRDGCIDTANKNGDPKAAAADLCNGTSFTNPHLIVDRGGVLHLATSKANPECSIIFQTDEALALAR